MENENVESTMTEAEASAFDTGWDDEPAETYADEAEDTAAEQTESAEGAGEGGADQPADEGAEAQTAESGEEKTQTMDGLELKYMGETRRVGRDEAVVLAQKGMDYDRIRKERDDMSKELEGLRGDKTKLAGYEDFLDRLARSVGMNIPDMIDSTLAKMLVAEEQKKGNTITEEFARQRIAFDREKAEYEKQKNQGADHSPVKKADGDKPQEPPAGPTADEAARAKRNDEANAFLQAYPDIDPKTIPEEVLKEWRGGTPLLSAYKDFEYKKLKADYEALKQNNKNSERSTGSVKSAGAGKAKDAFDEGWDSI